MKKRVPVYLWSCPRCSLQSIRQTLNVARNGGVERSLSGLHLRTCPRYSLQNIRKSHPLTRLFDFCRTGVGHRRWAQQRTPALSPRPEPRLPGPPPPRSPGLSSLPSIFGNALCLHAPAPPRAKPEAETGGRGGNYFPRMPFLSFLSSCLFCLSGAAPRCSCLILFLSITEIVFDSGGGGPYAWRMFF